MNGTILKYLLLIFVILGNLYAFYAGIPIESLMNIHLMLAVSLLFIMFLARRNNKETIVNLLLLMFLLMLFGRSVGAMKVPMLPRIAPDRIVLILISLFFMVEFLLKKRRMPAVSGIEIAMIFFSAYVIFSMIISGTAVSKEGGVSIGVFLNAYAIPFFIFFISKNVVTDEYAIKKFFIFFSVIGLYLGLTGIFEYFQLRHLVFPSYIMNQFLGIHWTRARGPFLNAVTNGTAVGMIIFMLIHLIFHEKVKWKKMFLIISVICAFATLIFTLTRGCWMAFSIALLVVSIFSPRVRKMVLPSFIVLVAFLFFLSFYGHGNKGDIIAAQFENQTEDAFLETIYGRTIHENTITGRFDLYRLGLAMFRERPFFGYGYGGFHQAKKDFIDRNYGLKISEDIYIQEQSAYHDTYMGILIDLGLVGLGLMLFIIFNILMACMKLYGKLPQEAFIGKDFAIISLGIFLVLLIKAQSSDLRYSFLPNGLFFAIAGIISGLNGRTSLYDKFSRADRENE